MAKLEPTKGGYYLWLYLPSMPAAVIFILLFLAATVAHSWKIYKQRTWFCLAFAIGCLFEFIGYCARAASREQTGKLMPFCIQSIFILVPPALFAASIYMTLGRIIRAVHGGKYSIVRAEWVTKTFVLGDILSFVVQGSAGGLMVMQSMAKLGENLIIAGLFIQIVMFGLFAIAAMIFHMRMNRSPTLESYSDDIPWRQGLRMLYGVSALIMIRSIFRVIEYIMGQDGYLLRHEWTMYVFDSVPMLAVTVIFFVWYPGKLRCPRKDNGEISLENQSVK